MRAGRVDFIGVYLLTDNFAGIAYADGFELVRWYPSGELHRFAPEAVPTDTGLGRGRHNSAFHP